MGDPAGVGPEISRRARSSLGPAGPVFYVHGDPALYGPDAVAIDHPREAGAAWTAGVPVLPLALAEPAVPGVPAPANAPAVIASIEAGVAAVRAGDAAALVTNPIAKAVLYDAGFDHPGHTEFLAALTADLPVSGVRGPVMMLAGGGLRVTLATVHLPLAAVPAALSRAGVVRTLTLTAEALRRDFGVAEPRIALCGLNPHAGEAGALGREEIEILNPAAADVRAAGWDVRDAASADTLFHADARAAYDAAVAIYHDQGLIPVKTLDFHGGVNLTLGLPIVRASPDHGTAFSIAGSGRARPDSLVAALRMAAEIAARRAAVHADA